MVDEFCQQSSVESVVRSVCNQHGNTLQSKGWYSTFKTWRVYTTWAIPKFAVQNTLVWFVNENKYERKDIKRIHFFPTLPFRNSCFVFPFENTKILKIFIFLYSLCPLFKHSVVRALWKLLVMGSRYMFISNRVVYCNLVWVFL